VRSGRKPCEKVNSVQSISPLQLGGSGSPVAVVVAGASRFLLPICYAQKPYSAHQVLYASSQPDCQLQVRVLGMMAKMPAPTVAPARTGVVEAAGVAAADGAVEGRLVRWDAGRDGRPAVRHVTVTRLGQGRRLSAACSRSKRGCFTRAADQKYRKLCSLGR